jgi:Fe-S cluster assembly protein SufD
MSLASALKTGDLTQLPSRRDEDWRWTDLRGLIREPCRRPRPCSSARRLAGLSRGGQGGAVIDGRHNWWPGEDTDDDRVLRNDSPDNPYDHADLPMATLGRQGGATALPSSSSPATAAYVRFVSATDGRRITRFVVVPEAGHGRPAGKP